MGLRGDDRGASIPLTHALSLGITALLVAGLLLGSGQLLNRQADRVVEKGSADISESVANELIRADRLAASGDDSAFDSRVAFPARMGGDKYDIAITQGSTSSTAVVYTNATTVTYHVQVQLETDVCGRSVNGGPIKIVYDETNDCLTIQPTSR